MKGLTKERQMKTLKRKQITKRHSSKERNIFEIGSIFVLSSTSILVCAQ